MQNKISSVIISNMLTQIKKIKSAVLVACLGFNLNSLCKLEKNVSVKGKSVQSSKINENKTVKKDTSLKLAEQALANFDKDMKGIEITDEVKFALDKSLQTVVGFLGLVELLPDLYMSDMPEHYKARMMSLLNTSKMSGNLKKAQKALKKLFTSLEKIKKTTQSVELLYSYVQNAISDFGTELPNITDISVTPRGTVNYRLISTEVDPTMELIGAESTVTEDVIKAGTLTV